MLDLEYVNQNADLLAIADGRAHLKRVAVSGGGEWAGPCPFCGGKDRFVVQPLMHRWLCRHCTEGKWRNVIEYISRRDGLDPHRRADLQEICSRAIGYEPPTTGAIQVHITPQSYDPPDQIWQENVAYAIEQCSQRLYQRSAKHALDYLYSRKLQDSTIRKFKLGYSFGGEFGDLWIPKGITIPCMVDKTCWYLKVRLISGSPCK